MERQGEGSRYTIAEFRILKGLIPVQKTLNQWKHDYDMRIWTLGVTPQGEPIVLVARERIQPEE